MNKSKLTRTLMAAVSVVALSAVMYGCVHSGGDDPEPPVATPDPPDPDPVDVDRKAINDAIDEATTAIGALTAMSSDENVAAAQAKIYAAQTALNGTTVLPVTEVRELQGKIAAATASLTTKKTAIADYQAHQMQYRDAKDAVGTAETAVAGLTAMSSDADVMAADNAIANAESTVAAGAMLTDDEKATLNGAIEVAELSLANKKTQIAARKAQEEEDRQRTAAMSAVGAAEMAVSALANVSSGDDVMAAQGLIDAAKAAVSGTTALPASEVIALNGRISAAETALGTKQTAIDNYRTHMSQHAAAMSAVGEARTAVAGLHAMSTDEAISDAETKIAAAKQAVMDGTMLTDEEKSGLNGAIATAEDDLVGKGALIAAYRTHGNQYTAAMEAVGDATTAVAGLTESSSDGDIDAAQAAITAAEDAVAKGASLSEDEKERLNGRIALAKVSLGENQIAIDSYRMHMSQHTDAMDAVSNAESAVAALTIDSSDADVTAAEVKIAAAKQTVMDGTTLSGEEKAALNGKITAAETSLGTVMAQIDLRKQRDTALKLAQLHGEASGATTDAMKAAEDAKAAEKQASDYIEKIGVLDVNGDSGEAAANAQKVLDAETDASEAAQDATAAKTRAQKAKTEATGLPEATVGRAALISALDAAIAAADEQITIATGIRDKKGSSSIAANVEVITGGNKKNLKTAADQGKVVADQIHAAFASDLKPVNRVVVPDGKITATAGKVMAGSDAQGMTFEMIVGAVNLVDKRISVLANTTKAVKAKSIAGLDAKKASGSLTSTTYDNGYQTDAKSRYKGILGTVFCAGDDCMVDVDGNLAGSWYFTPAGDADRTYIAKADAAGTYELEGEDSYVRYGYWLSLSGEIVTINRYGVGPTASKDVYDVKPNIDAFKGTSATYTGDALGMSVYKTFDGKGKEAGRASGGFEADVSLTMNFGNAPSLEGTIDNFEGSAVDTDWSVDLSHDIGKFVDGSLAATAGVTNDDTKWEGSWTATAWGGGSKTTGEEARPTGVYGGFDAEFSNGNVAGVYNTRKQ